MIPVTDAERALIAAHRLRNLGITEPRPRTAVDAVIRLGAMQAQDWPGTRWAIGLRTGLTADQVDAALDGGGLVRTWPMRGTLHLAPAAEIRWMLALMAPPALRKGERLRQHLGLDAPTLERCRALLVERVDAGGGRASRASLVAALDDAGIPTSDQRATLALGWSCQTGVLCQAGTADGAPTFARLDSVAPPAAPLSREEALARLAERYIRGHGPATDADLAWWSGLGLTDCRAGLAAARGLARRDLGGVAHWVPADPDDDGSGEPSADGVHLLHGFDEWLLGYRDRGAVLDPAHAERVCPGKNGVFQPTVVRDGRVIGTWRRKTTVRRASTTTELGLELFDPADKIDRDVLDALAARYAAFAGGEAGWTTA